MYRHHHASAPRNLPASYAENEFPMIHALLPVRRLSFAALAVLACSMSLAADWDRFRGPDGAGTAEVSGLPTTWSDSENVIWRTELPGPGTSSPVIVGDRVFMTSYTGYGIDEAAPGEQSALRRQLVCVDRKDGKILWMREEEPRLPEQDYAGFLALHGYASSTPVTDGQLVYVFYGITGVLAYDLDGNLKWRADVGSQLDGWGSAASPILYGDTVIVNACVESGALVALDATTGAERWRAEGMTRTWATPILVDLPDGKQELVNSVQGRLLGFDPETGERLWYCEGIPDYVCPSVVAKDGVVYAIGARKGTALAVRAGGRGDVTSSHVVWQQRSGSNVSSPAIYGDHLYWVSDAGIAHCLQLSDGEVVYKKRIDDSGRLYASVLAADDKLFAVSREKGTFVLKAGPEFEVLAQNVFKSDPSVFNGSPAVDDGQILLRSNRYLYCLGAK